MMLLKFHILTGLLPPTANSGPRMFVAEAEAE
jgi:hypothetical protein